MDIKLALGDVTALPSDVADVLTAVAYGPHPPGLSLETVVELRYGERDLMPFRPRLEIAGDTLHVHLQLWLAPGLGHTFEPIGHSASLTGLLSDGTTIESEDARMVRWGGYSEGEESECKLRATLRAFPATIMPTSATPRFWFSPVKVNGVRICGNLWIRSGNSLSGGHLRFSSCLHDYYFIKAKDNDADWYLVVDCRGSMRPVQEELSMDLPAMMFTLGQGFFVDGLSGLGRGMRVEGWMGLGVGPRHESRQFILPTQSNMPGEPWMMSLFEKLTVSMREDRKRAPKMRIHLERASSYYVDTVREAVLDVQYLKLHVALEATARTLTRLKDLGGPSVLVYDSKEWETWVVSRKDEIEKHGITPEAATMLLNKVKSAQQPPATDVVARCFRLFGHSITEPMEDEIEARNPIVHAARFVQEGADVNDALQRIAVVRSMLTAIISLAICFDGPIVGWSKTIVGDWGMAPDSFWKTGVPPAAHRYFADRLPATIDPVLLVDQSPPTPVNTVSRKGR